MSHTYGVSCGRSLAILVAGRTKELSPELKERFVRFAKSLGLKDDNIIFSVPTGNGQLGRQARDVGMWGLSKLVLTYQGKGKLHPPL